MGSVRLLALRRTSDRLILWTAATLGSSACVYLFFLFPLIPLLWPATLDVVQFVSSGVLQLVALPVLAVAAGIEGMRTRAQAREQHDAMIEMMREIREMHAELHAKLNARN